MSNTINIIAERKGAGPTQIEHPITKELLTGTPVPGTTDQDQVSFDVDIELPTPFTFTAVLGGKRFEFPKDVLYPGAFRYDVPEGSKYSSAGVFDGDKLLRLLWGNQPETPGAGKLGKWDGRLDNLQRAAGGEYTIKVLTHGLETTWEGPGGNSSWPNANLGTMQRGYQFLRNIVQATSGKLHYVKHFTEAESFVGYMLATDLKNKVELFPRWGVGTTTRFNATDGSGVYATRENRNKGNETVMPSWTTAYSDSTGKLLALPNATSYTPDPDHPEQAERAINFLNPGDTSNTPTGLAVQRSGNLLFMPYLGNKVTVAHKTSGAILGSTAISSVSSGTVDGQDNPWFITAGQVTKFAADATTGALTSTGATLPGLVAPLTISAYGDLIGVCDGGASQQFKLFRVSTQELLYTSPIAGGYVNNPNVSPQRFCFSDPAGSTDAPGLSLLADGSYWIVETTLCRAQHFSASHALIEQITYIDHAYQLAADQNNPSRIIVKGLEYAIDYSKPWPDAAKLVKFWRPSFPKEFFKLSNPKQSIELSPIGTLATLPNNRLYAWTRERERDVYREQELGTTGTRLTGATESAPVSMGADGSLNYAGFINSGKDYETRARYLTSIDANGNPQRAAAVRVHIARNIGDQAPVDYSGYGYQNAFVRTASGKLVFFRGGLMRVLGGKVYGDGPHIGIATPGVEGYTALTAYATTGAEFRGEYPTDGSYNVGRHANYKAGEQKGYVGEQVRAAGELIYTNDPGEFSGPQSKQQNIHILHHSSGLAVLVWGPTYKDADASPTGYFPGMAGGVQMGEWVIDPINPDLGYVYEVDEGAFGFARWMVKYLNTIKLTTVGTVRTAAATQYTRRLASDTADLLAAVPSRSNFQAGVAGFTQTPLTEDLSAEFGGSYWGVRTSIKKYDRFDTPDVFIRFRQSNKTNTFAFPSCLPTGTTSADWQLRELLNFEEHSFNDGELADSTSGGLYHDLLDQSGKVLVRFYLKANYAVNPSQATIYANDKVVATGLLSVLGNVAALNQELVHTNASGTATVQYGAYPAVTLSAPFTAGGDFSAPGRVVVTCWHKGAEGVNRDRCVDISRLWFTLGKPTPPPQPGGTDARVAPDPATGPPAGLTYEGDLMVLSGMADPDGVIRIKNRSIAGTVTFNCGSTEVEMSNCIVVHPPNKRGISGGSGTHLTMFDVAVYCNNVTMDGNAREHGIFLHESTYLDIHHVTVESSGSIKINYWKGTNTAKCRITNIRVRNTVGRRGDFRHPIQISNVQTSGLELGFFESFNEPDKSCTEDSVNIYNSGSPIDGVDFVGKGFYLHGSYPFPATNSTFTGAAFSADGSGKSEEPPTQNVLLQDAWLVSNCNAAANIATGRNIRYKNVHAVTCGYLPDGRLLQATYRGFNISNFYGSGLGTGNSMSGITSMFIRTKDLTPSTLRRADFVADPAIASDVPDPGIDTAGAILLTTPTSVAAGLALEAKQFIEWRDYLNANNQTCGSRYNPLPS